MTKLQNDTSKAGTKEKWGENIPGETFGKGKEDSSTSKKGESKGPKEGVSTSSNGGSELKVLSQPSTKQTRIDQV